MRLPLRTDTGAAEQPLAGRRSIRRAGALVLAALVLAAAACKSTTNVGSVVPIAGNFLLVQVNASSLPYLDQNLNTYVVRGSIDIKDNERYDFVETDSAGGVATDVTSSGYWVATGNAMALHDDNGTDVYVAALSAQWDTVRVQFNSHLGTFVRQ